MSWVYTIDANVAVRCTTGQSVYTAKWEIGQTSEHHIRMWSWGSRWLQPFAIIWGSGFNICTIHGTLSGWLSLFRIYHQLHRLVTSFHNKGMSVIGELIPYSQAPGIKKPWRPSHVSSKTKGGSYLAASQGNSDVPEAESVDQAALHLSFQSS